MLHNRHHLYALLFTFIFVSISVTLNQLLEQENVVLEYWTLRKKDLDDCQKFVHFEQSAKEVGEIHVDGFV